MIENTFKIEKFGNNDLITLFVNNISNINELIESLPFINDKFDTVVLNERTNDFDKKLFNEIIKRIKYKYFIKDSFRIADVFSIIDDAEFLMMSETATTGKTFSDSTLALMDLYAPAKVSLFAIFSPVENHIIKKQVK